AGDTIRNDVQVSRIDVGKVEFEILFIRGYLPQQFAEIRPYIQPVAARIIPDKLEFPVTEFEAVSELLQHRGERLAAKYSDRCLDGAIAALHRTAFLNLHVERLVAVNIGVVATNDPSRDAVSQPSDQILQSGKAAIKRPS